jgi:hypothetical protein
MGSQWVEDPSWGNIFGNIASDFAAAPQKALSARMMAEKIKAEQLDRQIKAQQLQQGLATGEAYAATLPNAGPANTPFEMNLPNVDEAGNWTMSTGSFNTPDSWSDPAAAAKFQADRKFLEATGRQAALAGKTGEMPALYGYGQVGAGGIPTTAAERGRLEFMSTGKFPSSDESKLPVKNWAEMDANNQPTGRVVASQAAPGSNYVLTGPQSTTAANPIETVPIAQNNFNQAAEKIMRRMASGEEVPVAELRDAIKLRDRGWEKEVDLREDPETKRLTPISKYKTEPPTTGAAGFLFQMLRDVESGAHMRVPVVPPAPAQAPPPPGGGPTATATATAAAAVPAAVVPPSAAVPASGPPPLVTAGAPVTAGDPSPVVQRYMHNPVVVSMENAKNGYSALVGNMPYNNAASDLAIVVGAAKVLDPPSVVREGEVENVKKTGGVMDQFVGLLDKAQGGAGLTPQVRAQLWQMVNAKLELDVKNMEPLRQQHAVQLRQRGTDPEAYLPPLPQLAPVDPNVISKKDVRTGPGSAAAPQSTNPTVDEILQGRR